MNTETIRFWKDKAEALERERVETYRVLAALCDWDALQGGSESRAWSDAHRLRAMMQGCAPSPDRLRPFKFRPHGGA